MSIGLCALHQNIRKGRATVKRQIFKFRYNLHLRWKMKDSKEICVKCLASYLMISIWFLSLNVILKMINSHCLRQQFILLTKQSYNSSIWRVIFSTMANKLQKQEKWVKISRILFYSFDLISNLPYYIRKSPKVIVMTTVYRINETIPYFIGSTDHFYSPTNLLLKQ